MVNLIKTLLEDANPIDAIIDTGAKAYNAADDTNLSNAAYAESIKTIEALRKQMLDDISESAAAIASEVRDIAECKPNEKIFEIATYPYILNPKAYMVHMPSEEDVRELSVMTNVSNMVKPYNLNGDFANDDNGTFVSKVGLVKNMFILAMTGEKITAKITCKTLKDSARALISEVIPMMKDNLYGECIAAIKMIVEHKGKTPDYYDKIVKNISAVTAFNMGVIAAAFKNLNTIYTYYITMAKQDNSAPMTEAAGISVSDYVAELNKAVKEVRDYYDKFKYKEIVTPRYKHIDKMEEYVRGALDRKYKLQIPMYKIAGVSDKCKHLVDDVFVPAIRKILTKYPNYIVYAPKLTDDADKFIYITLQEPFGKSEDDKTDRKTQDKVDKVVLDKKYPSAIVNETAISSDEKNVLDDNQFGIPKLRAYPLNDEAHIRKAVQMFSYCKPENKKLLARNIANAVIRNNLVGQITVTKANKFISYFPTWMKYTDATMEVNDGVYKILVDGKMISKGKVQTITEGVEYASDIDVFTADGRLF